MNTAPTDDALLRSVLNALPCGVAVFDGEGRMVFTNPHLIDLAGVDSSALAPGTALSDAVRLAAYRGLYGAGHPDEQAAAALGLDRRRLSRRLIRGLKGRWFDLTTVPLGDGGFVTVILEVTGLKVAELAAIERASRIEAVVNTLSEGVALFDSEQRLVLHNPAFGTVIGADAAMLADRPSLAELAARLRGSGALTDSADQDLASILGDGSVQPISGQYSRANGAAIHYTRMPARDSGFVVSVDDISALKLAEGEARHRVVVLEAMLAALPHGVCVYGHDRRVRMFNQAYTRIMEGELVAVGEHYSDMVRRRTASGELGPGDPEEIVRIQLGYPLNRPQMRQRVRPNGTAIDVRTAPLPDGGHIVVITDITAIFRAEEEARSRGAILETMLETMRHGVMLFGPDRRLIAANHLAARLAGQEPDDLVPGALHDDLVRRLYDKGEFGAGPEAQALLEQLLQRDHTIPSRHTRRGYDGRMLEVAFDPTADGGFVISYVDVTPLTHAEEEAQQRAEIQRYVLDNLRVGVQMYGADNRLIASNTLAATLAGLPPAAFRTGRLITEIFAELVRSGHLDAERAARILRNDRAVAMRYRMKWLDGIVLEVSSDPTPDGGYIVLLSDITALVQAEVEAEHRSGLMKIMLESTRHGIRLLDAEGRVLAANALSQRLSGFPEGESLVGLTLAEIRARQVARGEISTEQKKSFEEYTPTGAMRTGRYERIRPDGTILVITTDLAPGGGFVRTYTDVTEDRRIQAELKAARAAATDRDASRELAALGEELRTKLQRIVGLSESLQTAAASSAMQESARAIIQASHDLLAMLDDKVNHTR